MLLASGLTVAFLVAGLSAFRILAGDRSEAVLSTMRTGTVLGAILIPLQIAAGDAHGLNTLDYQPAKVAAIEANWETGGNVPLVLFALPDEAAQENRFEIGIPSLASIILRRSPDGVVPGLKDFVAEDGTVLYPPVAPVFFSFRVMVGTGIAMLAVSWAGVWLLRRRGAAAMPRSWLFVAVGMTFSGWLATLAGWYTTEIGRQPWLVQGLLTTEAALGPVPPAMVLSTLLAYIALYALLLGAYVWVIFALARKAAEGEPAHVPAGAPTDATLPAE